MFHSKFMQALDLPTASICVHLVWVNWELKCVFLFEFMCHSFVSRKSINTKKWISFEVKLRNHQSICLDEVFQFNTNGSEYCYSQLVLLLEIVKYYYRYMSQKRCHNPFFLHIFSPHSLFRDNRILQIEMRLMINP